MRIEESFVLVTGGGSGLGEATCRLLDERGVPGLAILDCDQTRGEALARELGPHVCFCRVDVADCGQVEAAVEKAAQALGGIHVLVNVAGIVTSAKLLGRRGPIAMDEFDRTVRTNLYGTLHTIRCAVPKMTENEPNSEGERGLVVNVSSGAAFEGQVGQLAYCASKAAIIGMTFPLMRELAGYGIRVVAIAPGAFDTPVYDRLSPSVKASLIEQATFPHRLGRPAEFAHLVAEIIENPMHNGRTYQLDAGVVMAANPTRPIKSG